MGFLIFLLIGIFGFMTLIYYIDVICMDEIKKAKTSTEVLLIALIPILGLFVVSCKQRIEELENKSKFK